MYFDFDDRRPEVPRVRSAISIRAGVLLSLAVHVGFVLAVMFTPATLFEATPVQAILQQAQQSIRFVEMRPRIDRQARPKRPAEQSDLDRQSATRERAPESENAMPLSRGLTPEKSEGGQAAEETAASEPAPKPGAAPVGDLEARVPPDIAMRPQVSAPPSLGESFRNLQRYLQGESFNNPTGGDTDQKADIQFDSMGVDFGPWLRRFKNQVERNWLVPDVALGRRARTVVIQFDVLTNGTITDLRVVQPADIEALTTAALNALKLSNPTAVLPKEYPANSVFFTVTFYYYVARSP